MKDTEIIKKNQLSKKSNFSNGSYSCLFFEKGVPVSEGQKNLNDFLKDFELNYHYDIYYIDLVKDDIAIEYDGKGHDLGVRMGKISQEAFDEKELKKQNKILENFRLLRIIDKKDKFKKKISMENRKLITNFINSNEKFLEIIVN